MSKKVKHNETPLTLLGNQIKPGNNADDFRAVNKEMKDTFLSDFKGKIKIITSFPSIDTPTCNLQVKEFNKRAFELSEDVVILGISMDLPFAQNRFCESFMIENIFLLSDYKYNDFAKKYGLLIDEWQLLGRSVIIVDRNDVVRYVQIVEQIEKEPDYIDAINNLKIII